jgi:hypothetical protein
LARASGGPRVRKLARASGGPKARKAAAVRRAVRRWIGERRYKEIETFVNKRRSEGQSPEQIAAAVLKKFARRVDLEVLMYFCVV